MSDRFDFKIGVKGEKEFKKALSEINQNFKALGSEKGVFLISLRQILS